MPVRHAMFETNSSSSHSIVLGTNFVRDKMWKSCLSSDEGCFEIYRGYFQWGPERFTDAATKASYLATAIHIIRNDPAKQEVYLARLKRAVIEFTGVPNVVIKPYYHNGLHDGPDDDSGIDHMSEEVAFEVLNGDDAIEKIKNFVFNTNSILYITNDNSSNPWEDDDDAF